MENVKSGSESTKGSGRSLSTTSGSNWDTTPSGDSYIMHTVSDRMKFGNCTIRPSGEAAVAGYGSGRSLESSPWNRPLEKADKEGRGDLGG